ncbi:MAG: hypothetical protein ACLS9K_14045 [Lachnospira eligens]
MKKRFIAVTLSVMMLFSSNISVFAEGNDVSVKHSLKQIMLRLLIELVIRKWKLRR